MAGLYEIWKDPTRDDDDPERFRWTCTVHDHGGRPTRSARSTTGCPCWSRPRSSYRVARPECRVTRAVRGLLVPPSRTARGLPRVNAVNNVRNNGPELVDPIAVRGRARLRSSTWPRLRGPPRATPGWSPVTAPDRHARARSRRRRRLEAARPGRARDRTSHAGHHRVPHSSSHGTWPARRSPPAADPRRRHAPASTPSASARPSSSAVAAPAPGRRQEGAALGAVGCLALAFPLHPPGRPESSRLPSSHEPACPPWSMQGEQRRVREASRVSYVGTQTRGDSRRRPRVCSAKRAALPRRHARRCRGRVGVDRAQLVA